MSSTHTIKPHGSGNGSGDGGGGDDVWQLLLVTAVGPLIRWY